MKAFRILLPLIVFALVLGFIFSINFYLGSRFNHFFALNANWALIFIFIGLFFTMFLGVMRFINATSSLGSLTFKTAAILMGFYLYVLISTLIVDLIGLAINIDPVIMGSLSIVLASLICIYGIWNANNTRISNIEIKIPNLKAPFRAVHLTDTHLGHFRGKNTLKKVVELINKQNVDVVFFTGDFLDSKIQLKAESMAPLKDLNTPIYFVEGNHDLYTGVRAIKSFLTELGVIVLENEVKYWRDIQIIGLNHMAATSQDRKRPSIESVLKNITIETNKPSILLHHAPNGIKYANEAGINLYLAGHTHGGQMWPATYIAAMMFEVNKGLHKFNDMSVYVSQGTGTFGPPMRVGTYSELAILNIK